MKKDYLKVNAILNVEGLEFDKDGKVALTEDQVKALNEKMNALEEDVSDKQTLLDERDQQIKNLKNGDGDETHDIKGEENDGKSDVTAQSMYNDVKDYI